MEERPEIDEAAGLKALNDHAAKMAMFARGKHGPSIGYEQMLALLGDEEIMRFPVELRFDQPLGPGEFGHVEPKGDSPADGFWLNLHASFMGRGDLLPHIIAYHLVRVNYGDMATAECAEVYGSKLLGLDQDLYYEDLCSISDDLGGIPVESDLQMPATSGGCGSAGGFEQGSGCGSGAGSGCGH